MSKYNATTCGTNRTSALTVEMVDVDFFSPVKYVAKSRRPDACNPGRRWRTGFLFARVHRAFRIRSGERLAGRLVAGPFPVALLGTGLYTPIDH